MLYHESRHAEQHALIAVARHARKERRRHRGADGHSVGKAQRGHAQPPACARQLHASLYGPDAAKHWATVVDYQQKVKAVREAEARLLDWMIDSGADGGADVRTDKELKAAEKAT